jgi:alkanesulfonate monooxygenase SsuD/methylene tetrahydromethanopterin reductase-like flavin-dependent oxidoreductase (luciferase family)
MLSTFPQASAAFLARGVVDGEELVRVEREQGPFGVMKLWTPDKVDQIAFVATPDMLRDKLAAYAATGIDELSVMMINPPEEQPEIIRQLAAARPN